METFCRWSDYGLFKYALNQKTNLFLQNYLYFSWWILKELEESNSPILNFFKARMIPYIWNIYYWHIWHYLDADPESASAVGCSFSESDAESSLDSSRLVWVGSSSDSSDELILRNKISPIMYNLYENYLYFLLIRLAGCRETWAYWNDSSFFSFNWFVLWVSVVTDTIEALRTSSLARRNIPNTTSHIKSSKTEKWDDLSVSSALS